MVRSPKPHQESRSAGRHVMAQRLSFIRQIDDAYASGDLQARLRSIFDELRESCGSQRIEGDTAQFARFLEISFQRITPRCELLKNGRVIEGCDLCPGSSVRFSGVEPGNYCLRLDSGLVLWRRCLGSGDQCRAGQLTRKALTLAADTGISRKEAGRNSFELMGGTVRISVLPGLSAGEIHISVGHAEGGTQ